MEPTLRDGQRIVIRYARTTGRTPRPGALVVITLPPDQLGRERPVAVKRLTRVEPDGRLWVESDNTQDVHRVDSWTVGALPRSALVATLCFRLPG